jgi:hypothetical protein
MCNATMWELMKGLSQLSLLLGFDSPILEKHSVRANIGDGGSINLVSDEDDPVDRAFS